MSLPSRIQLNVPWFPQWDNVNAPWGTCNLTSAAMVMAFYGVRGDGNGQLEDQLFREVTRRGLSRHDPATIREMLHWKGLAGSRFTFQATWDQVKAHLRGGNPCIIHGSFTPSYHIMPIIGYDDGAYDGKGAFIVNDPAGEWAAGGYGGSPNGARKLYSYFLMDCVGRAANYDEAMACYRAGKRPSAGQITLWMHFAGR